MEQFFIPFKQAKELCKLNYYENNHWYMYWHETKDSEFLDSGYGWSYGDDYFQAPTYEQAFKFLLKEINKKFVTVAFDISFDVNGFNLIDVNNHINVMNAEALDYLINLLKNK